MTTKSIEYQAEGRTMIGQLALPEGTGKRPAVLVCHEGPGLDEHAISRAERLASLGYVAFALDYHGGGKPVPLDEVMPRLQGLLQDPQTIRSLGGAGLEILLGHPRTDTERVAAIGYCFGGTMSLELARGGANLAAVVGFHSGLGTTRPEDAANITGKVLVCIGADDPLVPLEQRNAFEAEMRTGGVDWQMIVYGGAAHSFTNPNASALNMPGIAYHEPTDRRSWQAMMSLFDETISSG